MAAQDTQTYLPKEQLDLPKAPLDLPKPPLDLPQPQGGEEKHLHEQHDQYYPPIEVKTLLAWSAPGRPYRKRDKEYFAGILLIAFLVTIIAFLFGEYLLMLVIASLVFVTFALALVPPHPYHYKITTEGVRIEDHFYLWEELYDFYFKRRNNIEVLHIRTRALIPGELTITLGELHVEQVKTILLQFLPFREVIKPTFMEKSGNWLSKTFPLEKSQP